MKKEYAIERAEWITSPFRVKSADERPDWGRAESEIQRAPLGDCGGLPLFSRSFSANGPVRATVEASALGVFDLYINGKRVGNDELKPGWTDYNRRVTFVTYDVTDLLVDGENVILAAVSRGWYAGRIAFSTYHDPIMCFRAALTVADRDGERTVTTDGEWLTTLGGQIGFSDIWDGEFVDFNRESFAALSSPGAGRAGWEKAKTIERAVALSPFSGPPVRERDGLAMKPASVTVHSGERANGTEFGERVAVRSSLGEDSFSLGRDEYAVVDFGQNAVGWPTFTVRGGKGTHLLVRFGEMLNDSGSAARGNDGPKGSVYTVNYRTAKSKLEFILSGGEDEARPLFTFFGFRYLEITADAPVEISRLVSRVVGSDIRETGSIVTSNEKVNRLISNILWGQRGNYLSVPTDCPQRNERLGWTGDAQVFAGTASYNADVDSFFRKWLADARDSQYEDGRYTNVIPGMTVGDAGGGAWADAGIIIPHIMMRMYGDLELVDEHFPSMEKYMAWIASRGAPVPEYGDWLAYEPTDKDYVSAAYYVLDAALMAEMAAATDRADRAEYYDSLGKELVGSFRARYLGEDGDLVKEHRTQTGYLLALMIGAFREDEKKRAVAALHDKIVKNGNRLSTGFLGSGIICRVLSECGDDALAYTLLLQDRDPSWLYSVDQGATTIWERWNSYTVERGFGDAGMNSFNHYAYGAIGEWLYRYAAGIECFPGEYGFRRVLLRPTPDLRADAEIPENEERLTRLSARYESVSGVIVSSWSLEDGFSYETEVPVPARLLLPAATDGEPFSFSVNGVVHRSDEYPREGGRIVLDLAPGKYLIEE
ncbi:MAG: family 78 glycoside hydrolase catalytic domain [Clostridia bacterium]|nr:family 78 glycoside hydrolase catalytic domain [Clostridia bacterium]